MKVGDLVQSKFPKIYGEGFGVVMAARRPPSITGTPRPPRYNIHWITSGEVSYSIPGIELRKVA